MYNLLTNKFFYNIQTIQIEAFFIALLISYLITPLIRSRALKLGIVDKPSKRKIHPKPVPRLGGVSIFVSVFFTSLIFLLAYWSYKLSIVGKFSVIGILIGGTIIFILGLLDDLEPISPTIKLIAQLFAATVAWYIGVRILHVVNPLYHADFFFFKLSVGTQFLEFSLLASYLITVLWIIGITNAINLMDGMDGLATGISLIIAIAIWSVAADYRINQPGGALMAATLAGGLLGFLRWNFNPARIFLGDSGAYLTGFVLACLAASCVVKKVALAVVLPVLILMFALPISDTIMAIIRRMLGKRSILEPDKEHFHHKILELGISQKLASYFLYFVCALLGFAATSLVSVKSSLRFLLLSSVVIFIVLFFTYVINWKRQRPFKKKSKG